MKFFHNLHLSSVSLIISNLFILFFAIHFNWSVYDVLVLFWAETAIVAFYFILRIPFLHSWVSVLMIPFLAIHMGGFMFVHLIIISGVASITDPGSVNSYSVFFNFLSMYWVALIPLFISHGVSFIFNFLKNKEYKKIQNKIKMSQYHPYRRIFVMHMTLIFGSFFMAFFRDPLWVVIILIIFKSLFDLNAHIKEHLVHIYK